MSVDEAVRIGSDPVRSWRFEVADAPALTFAVRCRDELRLPVPAEPDVPPSTAGAGEASAMLGFTSDLSADWLAWWRALLDRTYAGLRLAAVSGAHPATRLVTIPDSLDLIESGPLLDAAATVAAQPHDPSSSGALRLVPLAVVEEAVDETSRRNAVPAGVLHGAVHLLPGSTSWLAVVRPGYGVMTVTGTPPRHDTLHRFVCEVLESGLPDRG